MLDALFSAESLPEEAQQAEDERQAIEHVVPLVVFQHIGQGVLVAEPGIVDERDTRQPVAVLQLATPLQVILTTGKVPHEITPVHEVQLVGEEETEVLQLRRHLYRISLTVRIGAHDVVPLHAAKPCLVVSGVIGIMHTGEEHVLGVLVFSAVAHRFIAVGLVGINLLMANNDRRALFTDGVSVVAVFQLGSIGLSIEERLGAILLTVQVGAECEDVLGRVLIHGRIGCRPDHDDGIGRIAYHNHEHAKQRRIHEARFHQIALSLTAIHQQPAYGAKDEQADDDAAHAVTEERDAEQAD